MCEGGKGALCVCLCLRSCVYTLFAQVACCELSAEEHFYGVCACVVFEGHFYVRQHLLLLPPIPILTPIIIYGLSLEDFSVHLHLLISFIRLPLSLSLSHPPFSLQPLSFYFTLPSHFSLFFQIHTHTVQL